MSHSDQDPATRNDFAQEPADSLSAPVVGADAGSIAGEAAVAPPVDYLPVPPPESDLIAGLSMVAWIKIGIVSFLMIATFRYNLVRLWLKTNPFNGEANWRHAIFIPLIGLYYLYINHEDLLKGPVKPFVWGRFARPERLWIGLSLVLSGAAAIAASRFGGRFVPAPEYVFAVGWLVGITGAMILCLDWSIGLMLLGLLVFTYGIWPGQNDFLKDIGMVLTLFGVVLMLCGWQVMRVAWFPIIFLMCAVPWPELVYSKIAWPLQQLAASVAVGVLRFTGVAAFNNGTKIVITGAAGNLRTLNVAEACAGLRSLMTFISVGAAVAFLSNRSLWQKLVVTASAVPIAIFCNVLRVSGQGLLDHYVSQELSESFAHQFVGMIMLIPGFFLILLVAWILDKMFIEEVEDDNEAIVAAPQRSSHWHLPKAALKAASHAHRVADEPPARQTAKPAPPSNSPRPVVRRASAANASAAPASGAAPAAPRSRSTAPAQSSAAGRNANGKPAPAAAGPAGARPAGKGSTIRTRGAGAAPSANPQDRTPPVWTPRVGASGAAADSTSASAKPDKPEGT